MVWFGFGEDHTLGYNDYIQPCNVIDVSTPVLWHVHMYIYILI